MTDAAIRRHVARYPTVALVLQGGGALGAYQCGVYERLHEAGIAPNWFAGISIGAINAALIAGNPPGRRVERLREFWHRVSSGALVMALLEQPQGCMGFRDFLNEAAAHQGASRGFRWGDVWEWTATTFRP